MKALLFFGILSIIFSSNASAQNSDIETLKKLNKDFLGSIVNKDTATLGKILANDFILINPGGNKRNRADNLAGALAPNVKVVSVDIDSADVRLLSADVGLVAAWTTNVMIDDGKKMTLKICYQDVYMKRKSVWVAVAAHVMLLSSE